MTGLAGKCLIRDDEEDGLGLPDGLYEVPLIVADLPGALGLRAEERRSATGERSI